MKRKLFALLFCLCLLAALAVPAFAHSGDTPYIIDDAGLLWEHELAELEARAEEISNRYGCGVYIITVEDFTDYGYSNIDSFGSALYYDGGLGMGSGRDGVLLVLSMWGRDFNLRSEGTFGQTAFSPYALEKLENAVLDDLGEDYWYGGFSDYLDTCETYLEKAAQGKPFSRENDPAQIALRVAAVIGVPCLIALVVCLIFRAQMKTVHKKTEADAYMVLDTAQLRVCQDIFTHRTETRTKVQSSSSSSGGGHSRSGKF